MDAPMTNNRILPATVLQYPRGYFRVVHFNLCRRSSLSWLKGRQGTMEEPHGSKRWTAPSNLCLLVSMSYNMLTHHLLPCLGRYRFAPAVGGIPAQLPSI